MTSTDTILAHARTLIEGIPDCGLVTMTAEIDQSRGGIVCCRFTRDEYEGGETVGRIMRQRPVKSHVVIVEGGR
jgi:hypothetical protein